MTAADRGNPKIQVNGVHHGVPTNEVEALLAEVDTLRAIVAHRAVIEQAKGMLMERRHCTPDEAFLILVEESQRTNRKLRDLAAEQVRVR